MPRIIRALMLLALPGLAACASAAPATPAITDAASLVQAMHDRYADRWYQTLSFTQATMRVMPNDSVHHEVWLEWAQIPGKLRIEFEPHGGGNAVLYANDSMYVWRDGSLIRRLDQINPLMTLGFDVYRQAPERSLAQLRRMNFDLSKFHVDTLEGTPVYVVGAERGDTVSKQFAIEADRLLFMRMIDAYPPQPGKVQHIWFRRYERLGQGWIAPEVEMLVEGRRVFHEVYSDIRADEPADPARFAVPAGG